MRAQGDDGMNYTQEQLEYAEQKEINEIKREPCPYCGRELLETVGYSGMKRALRCVNCKTSGPVGNDAKDAIEKWNKMAADRMCGLNLEKGAETMIAAEKAHRISEENRNNVLSEEMDMVCREIEKQIASGKTEAVVFKELRKGVVERLRNLGYEVEKRKAEYNDIDTVISW